MTRESLMRLPDGRQLSWLEFGDPQGFPVLYCHGIPGSGLEAEAYDQAARQRGVRLIAPDRPGIAQSTLVKHRRVRDWAGDVRALVDYLGLAEFSIFGWSAGGPQALVAGATLAGRVRAIGLIGPQSYFPTWQSRLEDLVAHPLHTFLGGLMRIPVVGPRLVAASYRLDDGARGDRPDPEIYRKIFAESLRRGLSQGTRGSVVDTQALAKPWGIRIERVAELLAEQVPPLPVTIWHGGRDSLVGVKSSEMLAARLPACQLIVDPRATHLQSFLDNRDEVLETMTRPRVG